MGVAIAGMHYIGMSAMRMPTAMSLRTVRVALSVLIAVVASTAGLSIAFRRHQVGAARAGGAGDGPGGGRHALHRHVGGRVRRTALRRRTGGQAARPTARWAGRHGLVVWVVGATFVILFLALLASTISQQRAQRLLRTSEARFRVAAEAVGDIIWTNTPDGRMQGEQADWARFTGQTRAQYQELGWTDAVHPDDAGSTRVAWAEAVAGAAHLRLRAPRAPP